MQSFLSLNPLGQVPQLAAQRRVHQAFRWLHLHDGLLMDWQRTLVGIPAPPFGEERRAEWLLEQFRALGLTNTQIDAEGNVLGLLSSPDVGDLDLNNNQRAVVLSAHIDTVFPAGTEVTPRPPECGWLRPGACDNAAGVTGLLAIAAALIDASITLPCPVLFVGNVGEEGEGDCAACAFCISVHHGATASPPTLCSMVRAMRSRSPKRSGADAFSLP